MTETLAATLKRWRTERGLTQQALADRAHVDRPMITRIEGGKIADPGEAVRIRLAEALDIPPLLLHPQMLAEPEPTPLDAGVRLLAVSELVPSPLNPRQTFDEGEIAELAASIEENGILQNLVARRSGDFYEIIAGGRRLRALQLLVREQRWFGQAPNVPVKILRADDAAATALALLENLQRADVNPMEEARALARLHEADPETWSTKAIAEKLGKTPRYVQQRLALVTRTTPRVQEALAAGRIRFGQARALIGAPEQAQDKALRNLLASETEGWHPNTEAGIRRNAFAGLIPAAGARFDLADWPFGIVEGVDGERWLEGERDAYRGLQHIAAERMAEDLRAEWPWVEVCEHFWSRDFPAAETTGETRPRGVVIEVDWRGEITVHGNRVRGDVEMQPPAADDTIRAAQAAAADVVARQRARELAGERFNTSLRAALAKNHLTALRLLVLGMLAGGSPVDFEGGDWPESIAPWLRRAGIDTETETNDLPDAETVWQAVRDWSRDDLTSFLAAYAAGCAEGARLTWDRGERVLAVNPIAAALAVGWRIPLPADDAPDAPVAPAAGEPGSPPEPEAPDPETPTPPAEAAPAPVGDDPLAIPEFLRRPRPGDTD